MDKLAAMRFPVGRVSIVGDGLRIVEHVVGRSGLAREIGRGAAAGAAIGLVFGWFLGLFGLADPLVHGIVLGWWGLVIGAVLGAITGAVAYWLGGRRRLTWESSSCGRQPRPRPSAGRDRCLRKATRRARDL